MRPPRSVLLPRSVPQRSCGFRSKILPRLQWRFCWRVGLLASVIVLSALDLWAERLTYLAATIPASTPLVRYNRIVHAVRWYPMDRDLRWEPMIFADTYNKL